MALQAVTAKRFESRLLEKGVVESKTHHEFYGGDHGYKADMGIIVPGTPEYDEWVALNAQHIFQTYDEPPDLVIGTASGTNELALDVGIAVGARYGLQTEKYIDPNSPERPKVRLTQLARQVIKLLHPNFALFLEDIGTKGWTVVQPAVETRDLGVPRVEVQTTWPRQREMPKLDEEGIEWHGILDHPLETLTEEECIKRGPCQDGVPLIRYGEDKV